MGCTHSIAEPGLQNCRTIFKRAFELHLGVRQPGQGESTACEDNVLPTDGQKKATLLFCLPFLRKRIWGVRKVM